MSMVPQGSIMLPNYAFLFKKHKKQLPAPVNSVKFSQTIESEDRMHSSMILWHDICKAMSKLVCSLGLVLLLDAHAADGLPLFEEGFNQLDRVHMSMQLLNGKGRTGIRNSTRYKLMHKQSNNKLGVDNYDRKQETLHLYRLKENKLVHLANVESADRFGETRNPGKLQTEYNELVERHESLRKKSEMFTGDAWMGMMRLQEYSNLLDSLQDAEENCPNCVRNRRLLEQVWQTVSNEYYDQYGSFSQEQWSQSLYEVLKKAGGLLHTKLETYKAAKELVAGLDDRYSSFLNPEQYRFALHRPVPSELKYLAYQYTGVGIELGRRFSDGRFTIVAPFAGSPAEEAGILAGEELVSVNGISTQTLTVDEAATLMRGPIGSVVDLEVQSPEGRPRSLLIERRALPLPPLKEQIIDVGNGKIVLYLRLHYFTHEGTRRMASAIRGGESLGVDGYVLDLRNNPGGVFEEAISMAALWLDCDSCNIAETVRSNTSDIEDLVYSVGALPKEIFAKHPGALTHSPLLLITNRSSASASEVLAGALHDNKRAIIVGEKTFGKGVVQYYFPMDDGSGLKLTVAKYLTPSRYDITKMGGLLPDKPCKDYPHGKGRLDECIESALHELMKGTEKLEGKKPKILGPLPFRWMSFSKTMVQHFDIN